MSNPNIAFSKDIIKQVSDKMGMDESDVKKVFDSIFSYSKKIMKEDEITTVYFSQIGYMYVYREALRKRAEKASKYIDKCPTINHISNKKAIKKFNFLSEQLDKVKGYSKHKSIPVLNNKKLTKGMTFEELENFQNNEAENKKHSKSLY